MTSVSLQRKILERSGSVGRALDKGSKGFQFESHRRLSHGVTSLNMVFLLSAA